MIAFQPFRFCWAADSVTPQTTRWSHLGLCLVPDFSICFLFGQRLAQHRKLVFVARVTGSRTPTSCVTFTFTNNHDPQIIALATIIEILLLWQCNKLVCISNHGKSITEIFFTSFYLSRNLLTIRIFTLNLSAFVSWNIKIPTSFLRGETMSDSTFQETETSTQRIIEMLKETVWRETNALN